MLTYLRLLSAVQLDSGHARKSLDGEVERLPLQCAELLPVLLDETAHAHGPDPDEGHHGQAHACERGAAQEEHH